MDLAEIKARHAEGRPSNKVLAASARPMRDAFMLANKDRAALIAIADGLLQMVRDARAEASNQVIDINREARRLGVEEELDALDA